MNSYVYNSRTADKFVVRLPDNMRGQIQEIAGRSHRSMNSQIVSWLEACVELENKGITVSNDLSTGGNAENRVRQLEEMLGKILKYGQFFKGCIELDRYATDEKGQLLCGEEFERELRELFKNAAADPTTAEVTVADTQPKRNYVPRAGDPVVVKDSGMIGVVEKITTGCGQVGNPYFLAEVRLYNGDFIAYKFNQLMEPES